MLHWKCQRCRRQISSENGSRCTEVSQLHSHQSRYTVPLSITIMTMMMMMTMIVMMMFPSHPEEYPIRKEGEWLHEQLERDREA